MSSIHVVVVGAGIVGLAVGYHLIEAGAQVTLIDRDPEGDKASYGNAASIAVTEVLPAAAQGTLWRAFGWMVDPLGPVAIRPAHAHKMIPWLVRFMKADTPLAGEQIAQALAALNLRVYDDLLPMLKASGLADELHRQGALSIYETERGYRLDAEGWARKRTHGIECQPLTGAEAREWEPALGPRVQRAVFTPQWSHVNDPRLLVERFREWLLSRGVVIQRGEVLNVASGAAQQLTLELNGGRIKADRVVIAAGVWSGILAGRLGDRVLLESERGYNMTIADPGVALKHPLLFAERKFVATPLSCGLRIGGAAEFGGLNAPANFNRSRTLAKLACRYLPDLRVEQGTSWAGHRPSTPDSLPVIGRSPHHSSVFYAFGHGHLGLTQAATTGRLIRDLLYSRHTPIDMTPYAIARFR